MLALTRKLGEAITIGSDIRVVVLQVKGGAVRLGIEAPRSVAVHRDEVYARILEQNKLAAAMPLPPAIALSPAVVKRARAIQVQVAGGGVLRMIRKTHTYDTHDSD